MSGLAGLRKVAEQAAARGLKMPIPADRVLELLDRLEQAEQALARARELHAKHENTIHTRPEWICSHRHCVDDAGDQNAWPCPTIKAIDSPSQ